MKIIHDKSSKIAGIGVVPWTRLGLQRWFDNYLIISYYGWDLAKTPSTPQVISLEGKIKVSKKNAQQMVLSPGFRMLADGMLKDYKFTTYRPVQAGSDGLAKRFLAPDIDFTKTFENKVYFREQFVHDIPLVPHQIFERGDLEPTISSYRTLQTIAQKLVLQHEQLSGGKGTYLVLSLEDYERALSQLPPTGKVVVSAMIEGAQEVSVQACATRYGVIGGPPQKQIIRNPSLYNCKLANASTFCGAEIGTVSLSKELQDQLNEAVQSIGQTMYTAGFRGIFGVDCLVRDDELYVLEVNARLTGVTPLLTALYRDERDIPFYLLHVLELGNFDYKITNKITDTPSPGGLLILQSQQDKPVVVSKLLQSGVYHYQGNELTFVRKDSNFKTGDGSDDILLQAYVPTGALVKPGDRVLSVITRQAVLNSDNQLKTKYTKLVKQLYKSLEYQSVPARSTNSRASQPAVKRLTVGATVKVSFLGFGIKDILAKVDTGAASAVLHATNVREEVNRNGNKVLRFSPFDEPAANVVAREYTRRRFKSSNGQVERRYVIQTTIRLKGRRYPVAVSLTDRSSMKYPVLLGSKFLSEHNILVDLSKSGR